MTPMRRGGQDRLDHHDHSLRTTFTHVRSAGPSASSPPPAPQARFERFCPEYTEERPPEALDYRMPAAVYRPATCPMPTKLPQPADPGHYLVRRVRNAGTVHCQTRQLCIRDPLLQEAIAMEETEDGSWSIDFYDVLPARLDARDFRLYTCKSVIDVAGLNCHRCSRLLQFQIVDTSYNPQYTRRQQSLSMAHLTRTDASGVQKRGETL